MKNIAILLTLASASAVAGIPTGTIGAKEATHAPAPLTYCPPTTGPTTTHAVPEVQEYAALAGAALLGMEVLRRRRKARKA